MANENGMIAVDGAIDYMAAFYCGLSDAETADPMVAIAVNSFPERKEN